MIKKIISFIIVSLIIFKLILLNVVPKTMASNNAKLYLVFDKTTYNVGDIVNITFNLDQFSNLNEVKLQVKIKKDTFEPVVTDNKYFYFSSASIFKNDVINDFVDESYLRLRLIKDENITDGYFSSYKNNLCHLKLKTNKAIDNIYQYFTLENYESNGVSAYLFNTNDQLIEYELYTKEKIKVNWEKENYELDVFSNVPNFKEDIKVLNRQDGEYEYLEEKSIDTNIVGLKTIHIGIYDKTTADYIILSRPVVVVDKIAPVINYPSEIKVKDKVITSIDYLENIIISDNYDSFFDITKVYYTVDLKEVESKDKFDEYLKHNKNGYFKIIVKDNSLNTTTTELIKIEVIDTTSPIVNEIEIININDTDVDSFSLDSYFVVKDDYDHSPKIVFNYYDYNQLTNDEIKNILRVGENISFEYFVIDQDGNTSKTYQTKILVTDTIKPVVEVSDLEINDVNFDSSLYLSLVKVTDNFNKVCELIKKYYINEAEVSEVTFNELIQKGNSGYIEYYAIDSFYNQSEVKKQNIKVIDTTLPTILIDNIKEGEKYLKIDQINYNITDNFDNVIFEVYLDNEEYDNQLVKIGKHHFKIVATDSSGNISIQEVNFEIIEDNIIGCGDDVSCYLNNYIEVVIIVGVLLGFVLVMIVTSIVIKKQKNKIS